MFSSVRVLSWSVFMLLVVGYIFGILIFQLSEQLGRSNEPNLWDGLGAATLSLQQVATFNGINLIRERTEGAKAIIFIPVFFMFTSAASMGVINLVVGVLLTAVLERNHQDKMFDQTSMKLRQHRSLRRLRYGLRKHAARTMGANADQVMINRHILLAWLGGEDPNKAIPKKKSQRTSISMASTPANDDNSMAKKVADLKGTDLIGQAEIDRMTNDAMNVYKKKPKKGSFPKFFGVMRAYLCCCMRCIRKKEEEEEERVEHDWDQDMTAELPVLFQAAGLQQADIEAVCTEITNLMGEASGFTVDEFMECMIWMKTKVHPLDIVGLMRGLWLIYQRMDVLGSYLASVQDQLEECSETIKPLLRRLSDSAKHVTSDEQAKLKKKKRADQDNSATEESTKGKTELNSPEEIEMMQREADEREQLKSINTFDSVFACIVMLNSFTLGIQTTIRAERLTEITSESLEEPAFAWFVLDIFFVTAFSSELVLRTVYSWQIAVLGEHDTSLSIIPKCLNELTMNQAIEIIYFAPSLLSDGMFIFDIVMVSISAVDCFILRFAVSSLGALRLLSVVRMVRLVRLLHLIKPLSKLITGTQKSAMLIVRALVMLFTVIFSCSIFIVGQIGQHPHTQDDPEVQEKWGDMMSAIITLFSMSTFSNWSLRIEEVSKHEDFATLFPVFVILFLALCGLGITNLITGIMVQAAFKIMHTEDTNKSAMKIANAREVMGEAITRTFDQIDERVRVNRLRVQARVLRFRKAHLNAVNEARKQAARGGGEDSDEIYAEKKESDSMTEEERLAEEEERLAEELHQAVSTFDDSNFAEVKTCLWVSEVEVAIEVEVSLDSKAATPGAQGDPNLSTLSWEGGKSNPVAILPLDPHSAKSIVKLKENDDPRAAQSHLVTSLRTLIFRKVSFSRVFKFRFGGNFSTVLVRPDRVTAELHKTKDEIEDIAPVDRTKITIRELNFLLQDQAFRRSLMTLDLRPDQALMVYQKINLTGTEQVKVNDFMNSIVRIKRAVKGVDVAGAKSLMRRLVLEVEGVATNCTRCNECFKNVTEKLREAEIRDEVEAEMETERDVRQREYHDDLTARNNTLRSKVKYMKLFVDTARERESAQRHGGRLNITDAARDSALLDSLEAEDEEAARGREEEVSETASIRSVSPGWD